MDFLIADNHVPDDIYERVVAHFTKEELANLTLAVVTINAWNRFAISFRSEPGIYQSQQTITH
jgi:alkylhydroperoxidase family enzyme